MAQSAWQLAAACSVMCSKPGKGDIFCTRPDCLRTPTRGAHGVFRGDRAAGAWRCGKCTVAKRRGVFMQWRSRGEELSASGHTQTHGHRNTPLQTQHTSKHTYPQTHTHTLAQRHTDISHHPPHSQTWQHRANVYWTACRLGRFFFICYHNQHLQQTVHAATNTHSDTPVPSSWHFISTVYLLLVHLVYYCTHGRIF